MRTGPQYKIARRLGARIFPKTQTAKFTISGTEKKRTNKKSRSQLTEYGRQLLEKQKMRLTYGLSERQFAGYVKAARHEGADPAGRLAQSLEERLDNVIFRIGLVPSRAWARQVVNHGHILVDGVRVTIPSYAVRVGQKISVRPASRARGTFAAMTERLKNYQAPAWVKFDQESWTGELVARPMLTVADAGLNYGAILEFYSRV